MADITPKEVIELADGRERDWQVLYDRMDNDYEMWKNKEYTPERDGEQSYTSNKPVTFANQHISMLNESALNIAVDWSEDEKKREKSTLVEQFCRGALFANDMRLLSMLHPRLKEALSFYACIPAGYLISRVVVNKDTDEKTIFDITPCNPRQTFFDICDRGLLWVARRRMVTRKAIKAEYDIEVPVVNANDNDVTIIDYWDEKQNAVTCQEHQIWLKEPEDHDIGHVPFKVVPIGSMPMVMGTAVNADTIEQFGESIYKETRRLHTPINKLISWTMDMVRLGRWPNLVYESEGGKFVPEEPPPGGGTLPIKKGEDLRVAWEPKMPLDTTPLLALMLGEDQEGSAPAISHGNLPHPISGVLGDLLMTPIKIKLGIRQRAMEDMFLAICYELIEQYTKGGFNKVDLRGFDKKGKMFQVAVSPLDIKGDWFIKVNLGLDLPQDKMGKFAMADLAKKAELLSEDTIAEDILEVPDIDLEKKRKLEDFAKQIPSLRLLELSNHFMEEKKAQELAIVASEMAKFQQQGMGGQPQGQQGAPPPMPEQGMMPQGMPPSPEGMMPSPIPMEGGGLPMGPEGMPPMPEAPPMAPPMAPGIPPEVLQQILEMERLRRLNLIRG